MKISLVALITILISCNNGNKDIFLKENIYYCYSGYDETCFDICLYRSKNVLETKIFHLEHGALPKIESSYEDLVTKSTIKSDLDLVAYEQEFKYIILDGDSIPLYAQHVYGELPNEYMLILEKKCDSLYGSSLKDIRIERRFK